MSFDRLTEDEINIINNGLLALMNNYNEAEKLVDDTNIIVAIENKKSAINKILRKISEA